MTSPPPVHEVQPASPGVVWSVMIPVHNCAGLLERLLPGVVAQLEARTDVHIEVVDDGSDDDPHSVVEQLGRGVVTYHRNTQALGAARNFNRCVARSKGRYVHLLHGDDMVLPGFYAAMEAALDTNDSVAAVCRTEYIDEADNPVTTTRSERAGSGPWHDALQTLAVSNRIRPPGVVVRRAAYERIGGYREDLPHAADWEMWARLAANGSIYFVDEVLARYRVHDQSDTAQRARSGVNIEERRAAIRTVNALLPASAQRSSARKAFGYSALFAARTALRRLFAADPRAAGNQFVQAIRCLGCAVLPRVGQLSDPGRP